jgi:hypothetical protein
VSTFGQEKGWRTMNFGFNTNVRVADAMYHVQTEDRGPSHPFVDTVVYLSGRVVYKRSTNYHDFAADVPAADLAAKLRERLAAQHREVIADLEAGTLALHGKDPARQAPEVSEPEGDDLDLQLINPQTWLTAGQVNFEIKLSEKRSKKGVDGADVQACLEHEKRRTPCAEVRTDEEGCATLKFPMPPNIAEGSSLVVRARDGVRLAQLRFLLKSKPVGKTPAPVS